MNHENHHPSQPIPQPLCSAYESLLPLLSMNALVAEAAAPIAAHVATCAWCQLRLRQYETVALAIQRQFAIDESIAVPSLPFASFEENTMSEHENVRETVPPSALPIEIPAATPAPLRPPRPQRQRFTGFVAVAAALLIALLAALIFTQFPSHPKPHIAAKATATATPVPLKNWSQVPQLTFMGNPTMSTSDSRVIYEVVKGQTTTLRRTTDGGSTWQSIPFPFQVISSIPLSTSTVISTVRGTGSNRLASNSTMLSGYPDILQFLVSPLNPNVVWLQTNYRALLPPNCVALIPGYSAQPGKSDTINPMAAQRPDTPTSGQIYPPCIVQFLSTDGGQHWTQTAPNTVFPLGRVDPPAIWTQGQRLYARAYVNALSSLATNIYLMTSSDGGTTWTNASAGISDPICAAYPAPTGNIVFVITDASNDCYSSTKVWRSNDAGKHWTQVKQFKLTFEQMYVAAGSDPNTPIVYLFAADTASGTNATTLLVSQDGGNNWTSAPTPGDQPNLLGALEGYTAITSDGKVIAAFANDDNINDATLYSWQAGATQWRPIAPAPQTAIQSWVTFFLAIPSLSGSSGSDTLWYVNNPSDYTMEFYHLQL